MTDTPPPVTHRLDEDTQAGIAAAAQAVADGECIVVPTDTVYGIGADAFSAAAVGKLLAAKQRGTDMPPPVLIAERSMLRALTSDIPRDAMSLARNHWPGALTLILKAQRTLQLELGETHGTVAVRVPDHDELRQLLRRTGPLAVSSANVHAQPAANTCAEALDMLGDTVAVYLDGGATAGLGASTIIDFSRNERGEVLRQGAISFEELKRSAPRLTPLPDPAPAELDAPADETAGELEPPTTESGPEVGSTPVGAPVDEAPDGQQIQS